MNIKLLSIAIVASIFLSGCVTKIPVPNIRVVKTAEMKLNEKDSDLSANKSVRIKIKPIFGKIVNQFPQLVKTGVPFEFVKKEEKYSSKYKRNIWQDTRYTGLLEDFPLLPLPIFEVSITNNAKHVLKFSDAIMALEDSSGNTFDVLNKSDAKQYIKQALRIALTAKNVPNRQVNEAVDISDLYSDLLLIHLVDNNFKVLPGRTKKGFLAFNYGKFTKEAFKSFVYGQERLNVQLFEIPVSVNKAGKTTETASFSFNFDVKVHSKEEEYITYKYEFK